MKFNKTNFMYGFVIVLFILSERIPSLPFFVTLDHLHIKHVVMVFVLLISLINIKKINLNNSIGKAFKTILHCSIFLYLISLLYQIINLKFQFYSVEELYYFVAPLLFAFMLLYNVKDGKAEKFMDLFLVAGLFAFFLNRILNGTLTISNIVSLFDVRNLFIESVSLLVESDLSVYFMVLTIYYAYKRKKKKMFIAAIGTFLGYKRFAVLFLIIFLIGYYMRLFSKDKNVKKIIYYITVITFIAAPFAVYYMCTDSFANWFYIKFGLDFNRFTMTRFDIINAVIDQNLTNYGLGTITHFLVERNVAGQFNMHNDILKIYMECGLIGTIVFTNSFFSIVKSNCYSFLIMLFIFSELFLAHFLGVGSISFWILSYIAIFEIMLTDEKTNKIVGG